MLVLSMALAVAAAFAQNPPQTGQDKGIEPKTPVKRVRVDLTGFELGKAPPPKSSTQIGGGTRSTGGETTLLAPVIGRCYSATPSLAWTHTAQVQAFEVRLFDQAGTLVHRMPVSGRQAVLPADHQLEPGSTLQWGVQPRAAMLGGPSAKSTIKRLSAAELAEVSQQLKAAGPGAADPMEWSARVFTESSALVRCDFGVVRLDPALSEPRRPARTARRGVPAASSHAVPCRRRFRCGREAARRTTVMVAPRGLDRFESQFLSQSFRSRPSARQRGVIKECDLARRSLDGLRRSLASSRSPQSDSTER